MTNPSYIPCASRIFQALFEYKKGDYIRGWYKYSKTIVNLRTLMVTMSMVAVYSGIIGVPGLVRVGDYVRSSTDGATTLLKSIQYGINLIVVGSYPSLTSQANAGTFLSSGVEPVKNGITYCTYHRTLMCGSGISTHASSGGKSASGSCVIISRRKQQRLQNWSPVGRTGQGGLPGRGMLGCTL